MPDLEDIPGPGEAGFDPDQWEECEDEEKPLVFWWKVLISVLAIFLVGLFFWILEEHKRRQRERGRKPPEVPPEDTSGPEETVKSNEEENSPSSEQEIQPKKVHFYEMSPQNEQPQPVDVEEVEPELLQKRAGVSAQIEQMKPADEETEEEVKFRSNYSAQNEQTEPTDEEIELELLQKGAGVFARVEQIEQEVKFRSKGSAEEIEPVATDELPAFYTVARYSLSKLGTKRAQTEQEIELKLPESHEEVSATAVVEEREQQTTCVTILKYELQNESGALLKPGAALRESSDDTSIDKSLEKVKVTADQLEHLDENYDKIKSKLLAENAEVEAEIVKTPARDGASLGQEAPVLKVSADLLSAPNAQWEQEEEPSVSVSLPSMSSEADEMPSITTAPEIETYAAECRADSEIREELPADAEVQPEVPPKGGRPMDNLDVDIAVTTPSPPLSPDDSEENKISSMLEVLGTTNLTEAVSKIQTLQEVSDVMRKAGLQSSNLIFGIDYTASNKYQGENCFGGKSLHSIEDGVMNPYQQVITIMGKTLAPFATSGYIPAFGFGDVHTSDWSVFPLKKDGYCLSFDEVLNVYNTITPKTILSGPTNFAPLILQSTDICKLIGDYHILIIVADGQVTNERATRRAIVDACKYPLSIVVVGVGDGPWDMMRVFDESLPKRPWDNFHFVEFNKLAKETKNSDLEFAVESLMEIPDQYKKIKQLGLLDKKAEVPGN